MSRRLMCLFASLLVTFPATSQSLRDEATSTAIRALTAMQSYQKNGGWVSAYSLGQGVFWGENLPVTDDFITVQYPATPATASIFLRAGQVLDDSRWIDVAREAHTALRQLQSPAGGLPHEGAPAKGHASHGSFDDGVTTGTLDFFIAWWHYTGMPEDRAAVDSIGNFILSAQYPDSGGWPQSFPPPQSYGRCITFNDGNCSNIITSLFRLSRETGDSRYRDAALRGGECILKLQGGDGEAIWAQQYDPESLEPAWARKFEPPGYTPAESAGVCNTLVEFIAETGDPRYLDSLRHALRWYDDHRLENGRYARLYEPGTQRPVYGRRDVAEKVYGVGQACEGYAWQGDWFPDAAADAFKAISKAGIESWRNSQSAVVPRSGAPNEATVGALCRQLSPEGFWTSAPTDKERAELERRGIPTETAIVNLQTFENHMKILLNYLAEAPPIPKS